MATKTKTTDETAIDEAVTDGELVAQRSADVDAETTDEHRKVFVIPGDGDKPTADNYDHEANLAATEAYAAAHGLRLTGPVRFVKAEKYGPGGASWALTYAAPAIPAEREGSTVAEADELAD